jgi:hypothetical protein
MPLNVPRILIFDDIREDGITIAEAIWAAGYPVRYMEYPSDVVSTGESKFIGVRVIFMDMDLLGDQFVGDRTKNYSAVQSAIQACLGESNGPYILVTWSTYDQYAAELISYLMERLPVGLRPAYCKRLDKETLEDLSGKVSKYLSDMGPTGCLINWEKYIVNASCETIQELINLSSHADAVPPRDALRRLLYDLAMAEAGKHFAADNATGHLYSMLSQILNDRVLQPLKEPSDCGELIATGSTIDANHDWKEKLNVLIHIDTRLKDNPSVHAPGDVFIYEEGAHTLRIPIIDKQQILESAFKENIKGDLKTDDKIGLITDTELLLVEITPQCDFSTDKYVWNRYVVAAKVPIIYLNSKRPEYLFKSPPFKADDGYSFCILFNSRLTVTLHKETLLNNKLFRIRQPLLGDMMGWLARQNSRLGHVSIQ